MGSPIFTRMEFLKSDIEELGWSTGWSGTRIEFAAVTADSRKVAPGAVFFAFDGIKNLGKDFIPEVLDKGAAAVFADVKYESGMSGFLKSAGNPPVFFSGDFQDKSGQLASVLLGNPSEKIHCVAVTGTNGKTTTAWTIYRILKELGRHPSYIGTIGIELPESSSVATLTTPPLIENHNILYEALNQSGDFAVFETSSHGLAQGRLNGIHWRVGIFTNLTEDHRDYHGNMENYYLSKRILFENLLRQSALSLSYGHTQADADRPNLQPPSAIINVDDPYGKRLHEWIRSEDPSFNAISLGFSGDFRFDKIYPDWGGYSADITWKGKSYELKSRLIGAFNIYNLAAAFAALLVLGFKPEEVLPFIATTPGTPGRMEAYRLKSGALVVVDYAHTPDALRKALQTLRELNPDKLSVVFGCGGDRDREKRPLMGEIAGNFADQVVITNDNPRTENPADIIREIEAGLTGKTYRVAEDRRAAIEETALAMKSGEVLLVAGKGHEDYQILPQGRIYFSDREIASELSQLVPPANHWPGKKESYGKS